MKILVQVVRFFVGILFIFSGLVKANDPLGLSYKMQEFFDKWGMSEFNQHTLWLSIVMIAFEIIAGAALLLGWRMKLWSWLLLLLIIFFTFLTGYAFLSGKFKTCGCFGDCIPLKTLGSFIKDVVLVVLIVFLLLKRRYIKPLFTERISILLMVLVTLFSFGGQWYVLKYLPVKDCLPFKVGSDIKEGMKMPANAVPDSTVITFIYKKDGKEVSFTADKFPADFSADTYTYIKREDKVVKEGSNNIPPIHDFILYSITGTDTTEAVLTQPYSILLLAQDFEGDVSSWVKHVETLYTQAKQKNIPVFVITTQQKIGVEKLSATALAGVPVLACDGIALRTAARAVPTVLLLKQSTILDKQSSLRASVVAGQVEKLAALPAPVIVTQPTDTVAQ